MAARGAGAFSGLWDHAIPGLSVRASAVAFAQFRLALRSPRGRATMFTPFVTVILLTVLVSRRGEQLPFEWGSQRGLAIAAIGCYTSILSLLPIAANQFSVAGLLGLLWFAAAVAPGVLLSLVASQVLHRSDLLPFLMLAWCAIAFGLSQLLFLPVRKLLASRSETIAQCY